MRKLDTTREMFAIFFFINVCKTIQLLNYMLYTFMQTFTITLLFVIYTYAKLYNYFIICYIHLCKTIQLLYYLLYTFMQNYTIALLFVIYTHAKLYKYLSGVIICMILIVDALLAQQMAVESYNA